MIDNRVIETYLIEYLKKKGIQLKKSGAVLQLQCPVCKKEGFSAIIPPHTNFVNCFNCNAKRQTICDIVKTEYPKYTDEEVLSMNYEQILLVVKSILIWHLKI